MVARKKSMAFIIESFGISFTEHLFLLRRMGFLCVPFTVSEKQTLQNAHQVIYVMMNCLAKTD
jgi:hypothetical protein